MKRFVFIILFFCLAIPLSEAQELWKMKRYEVTGGLGPTFLFGDIGGFSKKENILGIRDLSFLQTRFNANLSLKYRITQDINIRVSLLYGLLHASDTRGSNEARGYDAATTIIEPVVVGEYYFIKNKAESSWLFNKNKDHGIFGILKSLDFYAFTGIGGLSYSVTPNDKLEAIQVTQGIKTGGFTAVIPAGIGSSLIFSPNINFGVEFAGRYSFTDNLDGYTSQYSSSNDVYYFLNFNVTYKLKTGATGWPSFR